MQTNSKRIAKNTFYLYIRMLLLMFINLYTSRVILNALGIEDYGIYNVVAGVVTMFTMVSGSLSTAISRFLTYSLGKGEQSKLSVIFSTSVNIQLGMAFIIVLLAETIGLWFLNEEMVIPEERMTAANWVYQISVVTFVFNLLSVPFNAAIIAHEKMSAFAYIGLFEGIGRLLVAFLIGISVFDKLVFFATMMSLLGLIIIIIYAWYCKKHFNEAVYRFVLDTTLLKEMSGFAGWNFLGSSAMILREHGGNLVINLFCGPAVNAARAIATKVNATVQAFINNFMMALNPQITKSYASGDYDYMFKLMLWGAKLSFFLMLLLSMPIMLNIDYILKLWLVVVPDHSGTFVVLILILAMSDILSGPLITAILATGKVRNYQIAVGTLQLMNIPVSYLFLSFGYAPEMVLVVAIVISNIAFFVRLFMLNKIIHLHVGEFIYKVYFNVVFVTFVAVVIPLLISSWLSQGLLRLILLSLLSVLCTLVTCYFVGLSRHERTLVHTKVAEVMEKFHNKHDS